ncbi:hypothetical protein [Microbispora sp. GKU 823]|uniref:hypothetical protein n=1 Tax=Microbispora sp. GKU 823 TaxID=1652100 RepID=UPI0009A2C49E|nr:hypothetical protein [Microbispora sp. GKU 823]OPG01800.1 hypothetical protein B1L11_43765 [Microbispora sp. GKU 823]
MVHETQWSVNDPIIDMAAMQALFPVTAQAAQTLGVDADLVTRLQAAIPKIRPLPRTDFGQTQVLGPSADSAGNDMLALSAQPTAAKHNVENLGLEPVWPYNLIRDSGNQSDLAQRTFSHRSYITRLAGRLERRRDRVHPAQGLPALLARCPATTAKHLGSRSIGL